MMKHLLVAATALALAGCGPEQAVVTDFNGHSVRLIKTGGGVSTIEKDIPFLNREADSTCRTAGKSGARFASSKILPNYQVEYLFLCY